MDDQLSKIETKLDKLDERLGDIDKTLVRQEENLKQHMYRTELLEESVQILREEFKPVKESVSQAKGATKLIVLIGTVVAIVVGVLKVIHSL